MLAAAQVVASVLDIEDMGIVQQPIGASRQDYNEHRLKKGPGGLSSLAYAARLNSRSCPSIGKSNMVFSNGH